MVLPSAVRRGDRKLKLLPDSREGDRKLKLLPDSREGDRKLKLVVSKLKLVGDKMLKRLEFFDDGGC